MVAACSSLGWLTIVAQLLRSPRNSGSPVSARIGGWPVSEPRRWRVWWIGPRGHTGAPSHAGGCRAKVLQLCRVERRGQDCIGPELGVPARTVSAILRRHQVPYLRDCDPLTGEIIRSSKATAVRYEHDHPGSWSIWTSRRSAVSPTVAAGKPTAVPGAALERRDGPGSGSTLCIPWSTTIPDWPTPRSCPTKPGPPARSFPYGLHATSPITASPGSNES
jgi:hypothetical protein